MSEGVEEVANEATLGTALELTDLQVYEVSARRRDSGFDDIEPLELDSTGTPTGEPAWKMSESIANADHLVAFRLRIEVHNTVVDGVVDAAVIFTKTRPFSASDELVHAFMRRQGALMLVPHLRAILRDATMQAGQPFLLPTIRLPLGDDGEQAPDE